MAEYKLSYTASEIDKRLGKVSTNENDIKNIEKAFESSGGDTISIPNYLSGTKTIYGSYIKISDTPISMAELQNGGSYVITYIDKGTESNMSFKNTGVQNYLGNANMLQFGAFISVIADITLSGETVSAGLYADAFSYTSNTYASSLTINGYTGFTSEKIKKSYLPEVSWNDVKDKPLEIVGSDTLTWDGNTEGLESVDIFGDGEMYYLVNEATPTNEEMSNGITFVMGSETHQLVAEEMVGNFYGLAPSGTEMYLVFVATVDNLTIGDTVISKKGIYICVYGDSVSLTIPGYTGFTSEKLKESYLPEHTHKISWDNVVNKPFETVGSDTLNWDGNTEGLEGIYFDVDGESVLGMVRVTDATFTKEDFANGGIIRLATETGVESEYTFISNNIFWATDTFAIFAIYDDNDNPVFSGWISTQDNQNVDGIIVNTGMYVNASASTIEDSHLLRLVSITINGYTGFKKWQIKEGYLPESIQQNINGLNEKIVQETNKLSNEKVNKTQLTNAVNTALAEAKLSGEFDGEDGKDYVLTDADKEEIAEKVPYVKVAEQPTFVDSKDEMTDKSKMYVLTTDGMFYKYTTKEIVTEGETVPNFTNLMNDSRSYTKAGYRYSQSGGGFQQENGSNSIVIYIPESTDLSNGLTLRIKPYTRPTTNRYAVYMGTNGQIFPNTADTNTDSAVPDDNGMLTIKIGNLGSNRYVVLFTGTLTSDLIVTANEPIEYTTTSGGTETITEWTSTGISYNQPADYENRVIANENNIEDLQNKDTELSNRIDILENSGVGLTMFIDPNGNDDNDGLSASTPKKTVTACVGAGASKISAKRGLYKEVVNLSNIDTLEIFPTDNNLTPTVGVQRSRIVFDTADTILLNSLSNYNSIKKVAYSNANECFNYVFTQGHYEKYTGTNHGYYTVLWLITDNIKNDVKLKPVSTVALCEAETNTFTWVDDVIYINADLTNVNEIRVPTVLGNAFSIITSNKVKLTDVEIDFAGRYNLFIQYCAEFELDNCVVKYSNSGSGFDIKNANGNLRNCYASRVHDGYGITGYGHTNYIDCVAEWCYDDGISHHIGSTGTVIGGRFEGNGKAGNAPAYGAKVNIYGGLYKDNGMRGVWYVTDPQTHEPTTGIVQNAVMVGNPIGLMVDDTCNVIALDCKYVDNTTDKSAIGTLIEY